jgi:hypothetical protein
MVAGAVTNLFHDVPQLWVSITMLDAEGPDSPFHANRCMFCCFSILASALTARFFLLRSGTICNTSCATKMMTMCSIFSLMYSLFNRLSAALLLQAARSHRSNDAKGDDVDEIMLEYMTALMLNSHSKSAPLQGALSSPSQDGQPSALPSSACKQIVPVVIDEIFERPSSASKGHDRIKKTKSAEIEGEPMLLRPIGANQISAATREAHEQILRRDLDVDVYGYSDDAAVSSVSQRKSVSAVVREILQHRTGMTRRSTFLEEGDKWTRYDAAAAHVLERLRICTDGQPTNVPRGYNIPANAQRVSTAFSDLIAATSSYVGSANITSTVSEQWATNEFDAGANSAGACSAGASSAGASSAGAGVSSANRTSRTSRSGSTSKTSRRAFGSGSTHGTSTSVSATSIHTAFYSADDTTTESDSASLRSFTTAIG